MMIRFNIRDLYRYSILFLFFINLSFLNIYSNLTFTLQNLTCYLSIILFVIYLFQKRKVKINFWILLSIGLIFLISLFNLYRGDAYFGNLITFGNKIVLSRNLLFILLAFPINEVLASKESQKFLRWIFILGMIAIVYRTFFWFLFNYMGINLAPGLFEEKGLNWTRYGNVRLQGLFLDGYVIAYLSNQIIQTKIYQKCYYLFLLAVVIFYEGYVYASRSQFIAFLSMFFVLYIFHEKKSVTKLLDFIIVPIIIVAVFFSSYFERFADSFSVSNSNFGAGTQVRIIGQKYYQNLWSSNKLLGFGWSDDGNIFMGWKYYLSDLRIVRMLYQFGVIGFLIYLLPLLNSLLFGFKYRYRENGILLLAISFFTIISSFSSQNIYDYNRILLLPILIALTNNVSMIKSK